jgi:hypothetical protein
MKDGNMKKWACGSIILIIGGLTLLLFVVGPPGQPPPGEFLHLYRPKTIPYIVSEGKLPGVTWQDDIHPIFLRNGCDSCHSRGKEATAEGMKDLALGLIDPQEPENPDHSYHELVYAEGPAQIREGETLRDGQCCWPRNYPADQRRRIWIGHAERSAIMHKLAHDYYDWNNTPRFLEEGLDLLWGLPMPWYHAAGGHHPTEAHEFKKRPFLNRALFRLSLWLGGSREELHPLPPRIPVRDRDFLRYWINHALQVMGEGTGIEVQVIDEGENAAKDAAVHLVGNFNYSTRQHVSDQIDLKTDQEGKARLSFPKYSVVSHFWFVAAERNGLKTEYQPVTVKAGEMSKIKLRLSQ